MSSQGSQHDPVTAAVNIFDSTCLYEVLETLSYGRPEACHRWAWCSALEVTCALVCLPSINYAPSPTKHAAPSGPFGLLLSELGSAVGAATASAETARTARERTKRWSRRNITRVRREYLAMMSATDEFDPWFDWFSRNVWMEHSQRLGGLFDQRFLPEIALVVDRPEAEMRRLWEISSDVRTVERITTAERSSDLFAEMRDAYVASGLVRGVYYDRLARGMRWQITHHPQRAGVLGYSNKPSLESQFDVPNTLSYFATILLAGAFSERPAHRRSRWTAAIGEARQAFYNGAIDLRERATEERAVDAAVKAARQLDISFHPSYLDNALSISVGMGLTTLTSFGLVGWEEFVIGSAATVGAWLLSKRNPSGTAIRVVSGRRGRLQDLATAGPGRVERHWG